MEEVTKERTNRRVVDMRINGNVLQMLCTWTVHEFFNPGKNEYLRVSAGVYDEQEWIDVPVIDTLTENRG